MYDLKNFSKDSTQGSPIFMEYQYGVLDSGKIKLYSNKFKFSMWNKSMNFFIHKFRKKSSITYLNTFFKTIHAK